MMDEADRLYRNNDASRRWSRSHHQRNYESDYADQRFSSSSGSRYQSDYRSGKERRSHHTAPALENRRRVFERDQRDHGRRWEPDYSDSYSDVEFKRHRYPSGDTSRDRARERERERVTEYKRFFQQQSVRAEDRSNKPSMRRQDSSTSQDSAFNRHYPEGLFEMYRSRYEVLLLLNFMR